ncbi:energy transducer TonB [Microbulbifer sp. THAF38]|uniref:energy transducer TonB n=1 Tax=Microbulbifer sp. THAF38 TaxID=2587856 RepID=UPI001267B38E|nr:energy transducer TonB [Microbulbifer sp. THAF38]
MSLNVMPVSEKPNIQMLNRGVEWKIRRTISPKMLYPKTEFDKGQEGWVLVRGDISKQGIANNLNVVDFSPSAVFNLAAIRYLRDSQFEPYKQKGKASILKGYYFLLIFELGEEHPRYKG